jgi:hypothetical protein
VPVAAGSDGVTPTAIVGVALPAPPEEQASVPGAAELAPGTAPELDGQVATAPTEDTTPGVIRLSGRVMLTLSPTAIVVCSAALSATWTCLVGEVPCMTVPPGWVLPPSCAETFVTRSAVGSNTTCPRFSAPFWVTPRAACSFITPVVVAGPNEADAGLS